MPFNELLNTRWQLLLLGNCKKILVFLHKNWGKGMKLGSHGALKVVQIEIRTGT